MKRFFIAVFIVLLASACNKEKDSGFDKIDHLYGKASQLYIEVAYEEGAQPYTVVGGNNIWSFTERNIGSLFENRTRPISVFTERNLSEMTMIPNQNKQSYTNADILSLAAQYKQLQSDENRVVVLVLFLDGYYNFSGTPELNVVGVSAGSFVVAVFKPVIESIPTGFLSNNRHNVEQATVVHEIGHAVGLVNNGVDMEVNHQDVQNGKHCTNQQCVMYWLNEGAGDMSSFMQGGLFGTGEPRVVFGTECLNDTRKYLN